MYGSNDNYYNTLFTPMSYDLGEGRSMLPPPPPRPTQPTPSTHIPVDFATALALAAATAAANSNNLSGSSSGNTNGAADRDRICDYSPNCYAPHSNSPADYTAMYYPRSATVGGENSTFYPTSTSWTYQPSQQDCDPLYLRTAGSSYNAGDPLQSSPFNGQFNDRIGVNTSPYMMYTNGGGEDLADRFNCVSLNDAMVAQQPHVYPASPLQQNDPLLSNQWQSYDRNAIGIAGPGGGRLNERYHQASCDPVFATNGDGQRTWAIVAGMKSTPDSADISNWTGTKRSPQFTTDMVNVGLNPDFTDVAGLGFRHNLHRQRIQKTSDRPTPGARHGIIRNGAYERLNDSGTSELEEAVAKAPILRGESLQARLMRQINPPTFNTSPSRARFFVIKSFSEDDIHRSIKYSIWCSTEAGNKKLNTAYTEAASAGVPIYLFFSVNGSGHFCGIAEMTSGVDYSTRSGVWAQDKWQGQFSVKWIYVKDVPNMVLRHIHLETNDNKPVTHSRDTTEVPLEHGQQVLDIFAKYDNATSILDDFDYYERREQQEVCRFH
ncbi:unnamed protein product [Mesocestoides corti]|uniref:YTH domain-containing protein n=1 Tax=Mesocestoides corti TaxID=53468 RepID=A0A0R3UF53_MESCO|nr:unnamed protein product [Mesocestoides corti]